MNPLFNEIIKNAEEKAKSIIVKAENEKTSILKNSYLRADREIEKEKNNLSIRLENIKLKEENLQRNFLRAETLKRTDDGYNQIMASFDQEIKLLYQDKNRCEKVLISFIVEAALGLGYTEAKVAYYAANPVNKEMLAKAEVILREKTGKDILLSLDERHTSCFGVVLSTMDNKISYNNQVDTRVRRFSKDIKKIVQEYTCKVE